MLHACLDNALLHFLLIETVVGGMIISTNMQLSVWHARLAAFSGRMLCKHWHSIVHTQDHGSSSTTQAAYTVHLHIACFLSA